MKFNDEENFLAKILISILEWSTFIISLLVVLFIADLINNIFRKVTNYIN